MGRLIDADKFISWLDCGHLRNPSEKCLSDLNVKQMIDSQPTAYDVDKVAIEISDYFQSYIRNCNLTEEDALTILYMEEHITKLVKGAIKVNKQDLKISDKCFECEIYWQNSDTDTECEGAEEPCHEFRQRKYLKEGVVKDE